MDFIYLDKNIEPLVSEFERRDTVALDIETSGLNPIDSRILLAQFGFRDVNFVVNAGLVGLDPILPYLSNPKWLKLIHQVKFEASFFQHFYGIDLKGTFDTYIAEVLIDFIARHDLEAVALKYANMVLNKSVRGTFHGMRPMSAFTEEQLQYAADDVIALFPIYEAQKNLLAKEDQTGIAQIEFELGNVVAAMELEGIPINVKKWRSKLDAHMLEHEKSRLKMNEIIFDNSDIPEQIGMFERDGINLNSQPQIKESLKSLGIDLPKNEKGKESTDERALSLIDHPVAKELLNYRGLQKIASSYGGSFLDKIHPFTGRLHPDFQQIGAATGRFSCREPNVQQIPEEFRECVGLEDHKIIAADYCLAPETKVLFDDLTWRRIDSVVIGDVLVGFDEDLSSKTRMRKSVVKNITKLVQPTYKIQTDRGSVVSSSLHRWPVRRVKGTKNSPRIRGGIHPYKRFWTATKDIRVGETISFFASPWEYDDSRDAGYLAGFFDGEASIHSTSVSFAQNPGSVLDNVLQILIDKGYDPRDSHSKTKIRKLYLAGDKAGLRFLGSIRPRRLLQNHYQMWENRRTWGALSKPAKILNIEYLGEQEVIGIETSTKTFIAEGFLTHNSQMELRILAELSGDELFTNALLEGQDLHKSTASVMFNISLDKVDKERRFIAKTLNFGITYGMGINKLKDMLNAEADRNGWATYSFEHAKGLLNQYKSTYVTATNWLRRTGDEAYLRGYSTTMMGRKRRFSRPFGLDDEEMSKRVASIKRQGANTPVQGSNADITKLAMVNLYRDFRMYKVRAAIINQVHDEIVVLAHNSQVETIKTLVEESMMTSAQEVLKKIPVKVDVTVSDFWVKG